jgi:hypothetical protein
VRNDTFYVDFRGLKLEKARVSDEDCRSRRVSDCDARSSRKRRIAAGRANERVAQMILEFAIYAEDQKRDWRDASVRECVERLTRALFAEPFEYGRVRVEICGLVDLRYSARRVRDGVMIAIAVVKRDLELATDEDEDDGDDAS